MDFEQLLFSIIKQFLNSVSTLLEIYLDNYILQLSISRCAIVENNFFIAVITSEILSVLVIAPKKR